jgi:hypothetical protein
VASIAFQFGLDINTLRHALTRDVDGSASVALGQALDILS